MLIPHRQLSTDALQSLIEDVVTRDGTDYGETETPLAVKVAQVKTQLDKGVWVIVFDDVEGNIAIIPKNDAQML
jgi:uncharacterized protein YheU (UPF0270 family)